MARYISREIQRQVAQLMIEADCTDEQLEKVGASLERKNGTRPNAFWSFVNNSQR